MEDDGFGVPLFATSVWLMLKFSILVVFLVRLLVPSHPSERRVHLAVTAICCAFECWVCRILGSPNQHCFNWLSRHTSCGTLPCFNILFGIINLGEESWMLCFDRG